MDVLIATLITLCTPAAGAGGCDINIVEQVGENQILEVNNKSTGQIVRINIKTAKKTNRTKYTVTILDSMK